MTVNQRLKDDQVSVFFVLADFLHSALSWANCSAERIPFACLRKVLRLSFVQPAFTHSLCHASIFVFWSAVKLRLAKLAQAASFETFFAQHAFPPAKAGDATSIAAATTAVPRILIMVNRETRMNLRRSILCKVTRSSSSLRSRWTRRRLASA